MINLNKVIDTLLDYIYNQKHEIGQVSEILKTSGFDYNKANSYIICSKLEKLDLFELVKQNTNDGADFIIYPSHTGYEFVSEYETYSNYLIVSAMQRQRQNKLSEKDAKGSFLGGISGIATLAFSLSVFIYTIYQDNKQNKINDEVIKAIEKLNEESQHKQYKYQIHPQTRQNMDSLAISDKQ